MRIDSVVSSRKSALLGPVGLMAAALLGLDYRLQQLSWPEALVAAVLFVAPCVILGSLVWRKLLERRRNLPPVHTLLLHTLVAIAFSMVWTVVFSLIVYLWYPEFMPEFLRDGVLWQFTWGLILYGGLALGARVQTRLNEQQLATARAELSALRAQLNPHFLFNTLHSLTQLAREDPAATQTALEQFGDLMRYVLDGGRDAMVEVSLEDEIRFVRSYLALEQLRLCDRLRVVESIDSEALETAIPPLLLQPLVENAVRHGLSPRREGGTIWLSVQLSDTRLLIEVADDGNGANPDFMRSSRGLGLKAVARQLEARFPKESALEITTQPRSGFAVRLSLPRSRLRQR